VRLLLVAPCFPPLHAVASLRTYGFARAWMRAGCQVTVLTTRKRPDQGGLELPRDGLDIVEVDYHIPCFLERWRQRHKSEGLPAAAGGPGRSTSWLLKGLRRLRQRSGIFAAVRMPDLTDYWIRPALAWVRRQSQRPAWDAVISSSGPYTAHLVAYHLVREGWARRWIADFRDLWTDNHIYRGLFPFTLWERWWERRILRCADLLVTVTEELAGRLRARGGRQVVVIYNGYDPESLRLLSPQPFFPADGVRRLVYPGTWYPQGQDAGPLLRAMQRLWQRRPELPQRFALVVAGWSQHLWRMQAERYGLQPLVQFLGILPYEETLRLERDADALLLLDWHDPRQGVLTGKVFEYLSAPGPILAVGGSPDSPLGQLLRRTGRGWHLGTQEEHIAQVLAKLIDQPELLRGTPNSQALAELTRPVQSLRLLAHIEALCQPAAAASLLPPQRRSA
jgi:glycosyltransferase involved in cell wall biosynthesis